MLQGKVYFTSHICQWTLHDIPEYVSFRAVTGVLSGTQAILRITCPVVMSA